MAETQSPPIFGWNLVTDTAEPAAERYEVEASGAMKLPEQAMDWDAFFALPKANVSREVAIKALIESRGDR